ncbi:MAG: hypothetical protein ISN28_02475 [Ectothiorhodospiraceae bacterium AqS1]|nr:hypothetical protein [Ectothiorhodospiraceae bacterium AqS1]
MANATERGVALSMLLESSDNHGGGVSVDGIAHMREALPFAKVYFWKDKGEEFAGGKVHAKVAVCDEHLCFISSANLTGHAMEKNMEAGTYRVTRDHQNRADLSGYDGQKPMMVYHVAIF